MPKNENKKRKQRERTLRCISCPACCIHFNCTVERKWKVLSGSAPRSNHMHVHIYCATYVRTHACVCVSNYRARLLNVCLARKRFVQQTPKTMSECQSDFSSLYRLYIYIFIKHNWNTLKYIFYILHTFFVTFLGHRATLMHFNDYQLYILRYFMAFRWVN